MGPRLVIGPLLLLVHPPNTPTLAHSQAPPLGHCPCDVIYIYLKSLLKKKMVVESRGGGSRPPNPPPPPGSAPGRPLRNASGFLYNTRLYITSLWALLEKPFDNLHFLQNISQKIQSLWEYLWGTILMTRSGTFVYMRYASAVGLLPWECQMGSSRTAFSIVTSRRSARISTMDPRLVLSLLLLVVQWAPD